VPIRNATVHAQILDQIMVVNFKDTLQSWELSADGVWRRVPPGRNPFRHMIIYDKPVAVRARLGVARAGGAVASAAAYAAGSDFARLGRKEVLLS